MILAQFYFRAGSHALCEPLHAQFTTKTMSRMYRTLMHTECQNTIVLYALQWSNSNYSKHIPRPEINPIMGTTD